MFKKKFENVIELLQRAHKNLETNSLEAELCQCLISDLKTLQKLDPQNKKNNREIERIVQLIRLEWKIFLSRF